MAQKVQTPSHLSLYQNSPYVGTLLKIHLEGNPNSKVRERKNVFTSFCENFSHLKVSQLTPIKIKEWLLELQKLNGYSDRNLNAIKPLLNHFFKFLLSEGYLHSNPIDRVKFNHRGPPTRQRVVMSEQEILGLLEGFKTHSPVVLYPFIFTVAHTGARKDEIRCLKWSGVDFETGFIHLPYSKNGNRRSIKMSEPLVQVLKSIPRVSEGVFLNQFGRPLSATQIDDGIIRLQTKYPSMKRWRCHDLRHSYAYNFLKRGGQMYQLQATLGHKSIQMTIDLYGQLRAADVAEVNLYANINHAQ